MGDDPFARTLDEGSKVVEVLKANGLEQGAKVDDGQPLKVIMMCEVPSNTLLAEEFLDIFDGFSIGSDDLTQLTLGLDREPRSWLRCSTNAIRRSRNCWLAIQIARAKGKYVGIRGQGPSDHADLAEWLLAQLIPGARLVILPDTGHGGALQDPDGFHAAVESLLDP